MEGEKITSAVLFAVLDEASEKTLLSSDIRNCEEGRIWDGSPSGIITDMNSLLACYSYLLEKALVGLYFIMQEMMYCHNMVSTLDIHKLTLYK